MPMQRQDFDKDDVKNADNYTYNRRDTTNGDAERELRLGELLDELRAMGAPDDCNIRDFCKGDNWFQSMRMWNEIQRDIRMFHLAYSDRCNKPKIAMIHSDGVLVPVIYDKPKVKPPELSDEELLSAYRAKKFKYEFGNSPDECNWHASVRRDLATKEEVNMRISSKRYNWDAK